MESRTAAAGCRRSGAENPLLRHATGRSLQERIPVQGNLDPILLLAGGAPMTARIRDIRHSFAGKPHIFNLGHGVVPPTPPEHVAELVAAVRTPL